MDENQNNQVNNDTPQPNQPQYQQAPQPQYQPQPQQYQPQPQQYQPQPQQYQPQPPQFQQPQPPYGQPMYQQPFQPPMFQPVSAPANGMGITSLILGIVALVFCWFPYLSLPTGLIGIILGAVSLKQRKQGNGIAVGGLVLSIIGFIAALVFLIFVVILVSNVTRYVY